MNETTTEAETGGSNITSTTSEEDTAGSFLDTLLDNADSVTETLTTDPREWTQAQIVGAAVGAAVAVILVGVLCYCCRRGRRRGGGGGGSGICSRAGGSNSNGSGSETIKPCKIQRPFVTRSSGSAVDSENKLPLGAILHGAQKLHLAKLDGSNVKVAVIDSGIDKDHPGFGGMVKKQEWYREGTPLSEDDHGTHVAGTIHLMAPKAELYDYRVFGANGMNGDEAIAKSIRQAIEDGCTVINMSLSISIPIVPSVESAVKFAASKGVVMVCAAGNGGDGDTMTNEMRTYPARWKETISVAAVKKEAGLPVANFSESNPQVDFAGIGVDVVSFKPGGGYQTMRGTSMAAPHVAGLIAALMTNGGYKNKASKLKKELASKFSFDIGAQGKDNSTGVGFATFLSKTEFDDLMKKNDNPGAAQVY